MALVNAFGNIALDQSVQDVVNKLETGARVNPENIVGKFREAFESFTPGVNWNLTTGTGDIVQVDGNAVSASYLVISKDPLTADTETSLTYTGSFDMPLEVAVGLAISQRVLGQELAVELVSTETSLATPADIAIASISQTTTVLTVTTSTAHGLTPGMRVGITGVTDTRVNYPALVVATIPNTTTFTCTAGPQGTIASFSAGPYTNQGSVYYRSAMGGARNGLSQIFENTTATNSSVYTRSASGDALPSGTAAGSHSITSASTVGTQAINAANTYAFLPANEFRFILQADRVQCVDVAVDSAGATSSRLLRTQVIPDPNKQYTLRFRATNNKALSTPAGKIVSASKAGSTTTTITTAEAHGLTAGEYVAVVGIRDQTNFVSTITNLQVLSVLNSTQFTTAFGASATTTSYGGCVIRQQGSNIPAAYTTVTAQSAFTAGLSNELQITGSANWAWSIGDYVNVYGLRDNTSGADLAVDGVYRVVDVASTVIRLAPINPSTVLPSFAATNCGGTVIKRTDTRIAFVRIFDYLRERVEVQPNPAGAASVPVIANGGSLAISSGSLTAFTPINTIVADITSTAITATTTSGTITPTASGCSQFNVMVTAASGTSPTLDVVVQESDDSGTNWYDTYHFPRITAAGQYRSPLIPMTGNRVRYVRTVGGTSPSFTSSVNRLVVNTAQPLQRQFFDRALAPNTLNSTTGSFFLEGCVDLNVFVSMGAVTTTPPILVLEISPNGSEWVQVGTDITTVASSNTLLQVSNAMGRFARVRVKTAGVGATMFYIMIRGIGA